MGLDTFKRKIFEKKANDWKTSDGASSIKRS